jgi:N-ethylmaleimide reductase
MTVRAECPLVGLHLSPLNSFNSMLDSNPLALASWLAEHLNGRGLAYLHLMRADMAGIQQADVLTPFRERFQGVLVATMSYTPVRPTRPSPLAWWMRWPLVGPSLPTRTCRHRLAIGGSLNEANPETYYTPGARGYTDYPVLAA